MKISKCDKCGKETKDDSDFFNIEDFKLFDESKFNFLDVIKPDLCIKCAKGYNKIISNVNKEIENYIKK